MKARMPAGFGRPDMNALMRQAQKMQEDMKAKQAELEAAEYTGSAAGEMVTVRMNGKHVSFSQMRLWVRAAASESRCTGPLGRGLSNRLR